MYNDYVIFHLFYIKYNFGEKLLPEHFRDFGIEIWLLFTANWTILDENLYQNKSSS